MLDFVFFFLNRTVLVVFQGVVKFSSIYAFCNSILSKTHVIIVVDGTLVKDVLERKIIFGEN